MTTKWNMYEPVDCRYCHNSRFTLEHYGGDGSYYNKVPCHCLKQKTPTKRYSKFLKEKASMTVCKHEKKQDKFIDNVGSFSADYVDTSRSW